MQAKRDKKHGSLFGDSTLLACTARDYVLYTWLG